MPPVLLACGAAWVALLGVAAAFPQDLVAWELLAAIPWGAAWLALRSRPERRTDAVLILTMAALGRAVLLLAPPVLSDDVYRYLWDGRVQLSGFDAYAHAPSAPELAALRDWHWPLINYPDVATLYPPLAQWLFCAVAALWPSPLAFRVIAALADLATAALLLALLRRRTCDARAALIYAWSPLAAVEAAVGGHVDAVAIALFVAALFAIEIGRPLRAGLLAGLSLCAKLGAAALLPLLARRRLVLLGVCIGLAPFLSHLGGPLMPGLGEYSRRWRHNESLFAPISAAARAVVGDEARQLPLVVARLVTGREETEVQPDEVAGALARATAAVLWLVLAALVVTRRLDVHRGALVLTSAGLLLSPVVHPWYVAWLLPLLALAPSTPLLLFTALAPLGYLALGSTWPRVVEYGLPALVAAVLVLPRRPGSRLPGGASWGA